VTEVSAIAIVEAIAPTVAAIAALVASIAALLVAIGAKKKADEAHDVAVKKLDSSESK